MESTVATVHPMGQAHQIPVAPRAVADRTNARITRRIRSVKVAVMNCFIMPVPRRMPSATSLADTTN